MRATGRAVSVRFLLALAVGVPALLAGTATALAADGKRSRDLLDVESVRVGAAKAPVVIRVAVPRSASLRTWVRGRPARVHAQRIGSRIRSVELTAHNGLRDATNPIRVRATLPSGRFDQASRAVRLAHGDPIADAGRDRSGIVDQTVTVGRDDPPVGVAKSRDPRWQILSAPSGSDAALVDPRSATPELTPDANGTYVLGLSVRGRGDTSRDRATLTARPDDPPIGVPIETLSSAPDGAIRLGGAPVKDTTDRNGIFVAVLERTTRRIVESGTVPRHGGGIAQLRSIAGRWGGDAGDDSYLMIVSGPSGINPADMSAFDNLVQFLGSEKLTPTNRTGLAAGAPFSIVGIPGGVDGAAWTRFGFGPDAASVGSIDGYLQINRAAVGGGPENYDFVSPDHLTFHTRADGAQETSNTMEIGGKRYSASLPDGATAGFHLVLIDAQNGNVLINFPAATNGGIYDNASGQAAIGNALASWADDHPTGAVLAIQSIGRPTGSTVGWNHAAEGIERWGGNRFVFNGLDGADSYALVGQADGTVPTVESSTLAAEQGELEGILTRDRHYRFAPILAADDLSPVTADMYAIAYQKPEGFPQFATEAEKRAETDIGIYLGFCGKGSPSCEMRRRYYENYAAAWGQKYNDLRDLTLARIQEELYPTAAPPYDGAALDAVRKVLLPEISAVNQVKNYFQVLQEPFGRAKSGSDLNLKRFGDELKNAVRASGGRSAGWGLQVIAAVMQLAPVSGEVAPLLGGTAGVMGLVSLFADGDGTPLLADDVQAKVDDLAQKLAVRYEAAQRGTTGIALMIVSDWGKLRTVKSKIDDPWKLPPDPGRAIDSLQLASSQWFAQALVPATYPNLLRATPPPVGSGTPNGTECFFYVTAKVKSYKHPWEGLPQNMQVKITLLHENDGRATRTSLWATRDFGYQPNASIGSILFDKPKPNTLALGLHPLRLFDPALFGGRVLSANDRAHKCDLPFPGWPW